MGFLSGRQQFGVAAILLAASSLLSRIMGLARDKIISWQFGASHEADMYFAAFVVPDIINYLLAGGFISITMIPLLAKTFRNDEKDAWNLFSAIFAWMLLASCLLTSCGEIWAVPLARLVAPGFEADQIQRLAFFMRIILPGQIFFLCGSCFTALLFLRRQFAVPALSPLIYNGSIILAGLGLPYFSSQRTEFGMTGYCIGVTVGAFLGAFLLPLLTACKGTLSLHIQPWHTGLKRFFIIALPLMLGQTVVMLDEQFLRIFGSMLPEGGVSLLNYGRRIAQVPVSLLGQAAAVASYPFLVRLVAENKSAEFDQTLNSALKTTLALIIPLSLWMIASTSPILGIIFEGGRFGAAETAACAPLAQIMLAPAAIWIIYMLLARAFYAHEDTITPALTGTVITLVCIPCYYWLIVPLGATGIALVSSLSISAYTLWLCLIWIRRHKKAAFEGIVSIAIRSFASSLPAAFCAWLVCLYWPQPNTYSFINHCIKGTLSMVVFVSIFLPLEWKLYPAPIKILLRKIRKHNNRA